MQVGKALCMIAIAMSLASLVDVPFAAADAWPMYRFDSGRRGVSAEALPDDLQLLWTRQLRPLTPAFHDTRLQFDAGHEPVVSDGILLIASSVSDSVTAYNADSGEQRWVFYTNGPIRFAPVIEGQLACFGSDDGYLYCVDLKTGRLRWKHQAVPSGRMLLGNRRLISVWPIRGGPVVESGVVYFAAGVWPFEGVFVYAVSVDTGEVLWRNDRMGYQFGQQPHNTQAIGGLAPQGYLLVQGDDLIVPCSNAYPARFNRHTGELIRFELPSAGRVPGGWFAALDLDQARAVRRGELTFDEVVNQQQHEDGPRTTDGGASGLSRQIRVGDALLKFDQPPVEVDGTVHSMVVAQGSLYVTTREGLLCCYGDSSRLASGAARHWEARIEKLETRAATRDRIEEILRQATGLHGIAFVIGLEDGDLVRALQAMTSYQIVAFDDEKKRVEQLRSELTRAKVDADRVAVYQLNDGPLSLPPYVATLLISEKAHVSLDAHLQSLRPFGGIAVSGRRADPDAVKLISPGGFQVDERISTGDWLIRRAGPLPGSTDYRGDFTLSSDELVKFPLGVLWFDDTLAHFKRSPQPVFDRGTMISRPKNWQAPRHKGDYKLDYPLLPPVLSDIYTGRVLDDSERQELRQGLVQSPPEGLEPSQYRPEGEPFSSKATPRIAGQRINPLTGQIETRLFPKTYGCDGGVDYGSFYTLRSGTAAFYDKTIESGTVFLSGPRSGCTNSIIPSGGVLNVPYFYEGCTCSYPLPTAMSLVAMPERFEQWSTWGEASIEPGSIQRIGLNFGAPGDRMTRDGTLWLDYPAIGGPSPSIHVETTGEVKYLYRHSLFMHPEDPFPWVSGSMAVGLNKLILKDLKSGNYEVRLYFAPLEIPGSPTIELSDQRIYLQGAPVHNEVKRVEKAEPRVSGIVVTARNVLIQDQLLLELDSVNDQTAISGIELIRDSTGN